MDISHPLVTSRRAGAAAYAPLSHEEVLNRASAWRTGRPLGAHEPLDVALLSGSWCLASSPRTYEHIMQAGEAFTLNDYGKKVPTYSQSPSESLVMAAGLGISILGAAGFLVMIAGMIFGWLPTNLFTLIIFLGCYFVPSACISLMDKGMEFFALRRLLQGPQAVEVATEWASILAAKEALPGSPLPRLYAAWKDASKPEERWAIEGVWAEVVAKEEVAHRQLLELPPGAMPLQVEIIQAAADRRRQGEAKARALASSESLLPLGEAMTNSTINPQDEVR